MKRTKLAEFPEWQESQKKLTELQLEYGAVDAEYQEVLQGFLQAQAQRSKDRLDSEAVALLMGEEPVVPVRSEAVEKLYHRRRVLARALELQREHIAELRTRLSKEICQAVRPEYSELVRDVATKLSALIKACERERAFRDDLFQADISFAGHIPPVPLRGVGRLDDQNSRAGQFLREAIQNGYLRSSELEVMQ